MSILVQKLEPDQYALAKCNVVLQIQPGYEVTIVGCRLIHKNGNTFVGMPQVTWKTNGETKRMNTVKVSEQMASDIRTAVVAEFQKAGGQIPQSAPQQAQGFNNQQQGFGGQPQQGFGQQQPPQQQAFGQQQGFGNQNRSGF